MPAKANDLSMDFIDSSPPNLCICDYIMDLNVHKLALNPIGTIDNPALCSALG